MTEPVPTSRSGGAFSTIKGEKKKTRLREKEKGGGRKVRRKRSPLPPRNHRQLEVTKRTQSKKVSQRHVKEKKACGGTRTFKRAESGLREKRKGRSVVGWVGEREGGFFGATTRLVEGKEENQVRGFFGHMKGGE